MAKYGPLTAYLRSQYPRELRMSFAEIEAVIGDRLPASKVNRAWWSNNPDNSAITRAWLTAGYKSARVDIDNERVTFVPASAYQGLSEGKQSGYRPEHSGKLSTDREQQKKARRHPALGALKGMITLRPDVDYSEPADPEWGKVYDD